MYIIKELNTGLYYTGKTFFPLSPDLKDAKLYKLKQEPQLLLATKYMHLMNPVLWNIVKHYLELHHNKDICEIDLSFEYLKSIAENYRLGIRQVDLIEKE